MFFLGKTRTIKEFSGSSPPEVFIGAYGYPNVYTGILSPEEHGDTSILSSPEAWHSNKLTIPQILENRNKLIYGRTQSHIKKYQSKFLSIMQEVAMVHKSIALEFQLKKPIIKNEERAPNVPLIAKAAEVSSVRLQENPSIRPKVDYLVNDSDAKSSITMLELEKSGVSTSSIIKLLSAGLLGLKHQRKLVPTRWAITATDDLLSKEKLKQIRYYPEISDIQVFSSYYLGNHYEFLLLPEKWSFEVIEISLKNLGVWHDYESFFPRKTYADSVTGAYYANRLAVTEYLEKIKRQSSCLVFREVRQEYIAPLGVGILRQTSREAFSNQPKKFSTIQDALADIQQRLKLHIDNFTSKSIILKNHGKQKKLSAFFN
jgi:hypothetical protein